MRLKRIKIYSISYAPELLDGLYNLTFHAEYMRKVWNFLLLRYKRKLIASSLQTRMSVGN